MENITQTSEEGETERKIALKAFEEMPQAQKFEMVQGLFTPEEAAALDDSDYKMIFNTALRYLEREPGATAIEDALAVGAIARAEALELMGGKSFRNYVYDNQGQVVGAGPDEKSAIERAKESTRE
jgi:hypothetical protein